MASVRRSLVAPTTDSPSTASASHGGGQAFGLGPRRAVRRAGVVAALVALAALVGVLLNQHGGSPAGLTRHGGSTAKSIHHSASAAKYGGLPSWLPKAKIPVGRTVQASHAHPALSIQGETVSVDLGGRRVLATAVGPSVPEEGQVPVPATSPCTFIVTFADASGVIALRTNAFTLIDDLGHVRHPQVTAMDGSAPPRRVLPGRTVSLTVHDVLPTGDGGLTWSPDGGRPIVAWDFSVEID